MPLPTGVYRADQVGSLLRPAEILTLREKIAQNQSPLSDLRPLEDKYIAQVVQKQISAGLRSITDGEFRRAFFHLDFLQHLDGIKVEGQIISTNTSKLGFRPPKLVVTGKLGHPKAIQVDDFRYLEKCIDEAGARGKASSKVAIPSPTMVPFRVDRSTIDENAYPNMDDLYPDLARVYQEELQDLYDSGCRFVQLDDTNLAYLCDEGMRAEAEKRQGVDANELTRRFVNLINEAISKRPKDMTIGIHLCRGNHRSQWFAQGGYEPVSEVLFKDLNVDAYFLEYDDARSGDFSPLRHLPKGKVVVLGVMTSKKGETDDEEAMVKRLNEAAKYCPEGLDQLCVSHQCGFSSTMEGNELSEEQQWEKIRAEVKIAQKVWGEDISK
jgi:5-methyltetrahydropteroyltriglutamate--homocysteine methyltransferase